ncbi:fumarylacetoacetate hydrolase family protein [Brevibacillus daliensis]|uniref:fumarylacetoacetate hydrolase family protein n=1 Tax=Brevibacillus daliensis TaxID=2892995 RepID=UPI001E4E4D1E|nr:fumarylacetoacetate hydrolase family protein [Brevibacillus daliensis]
MRLISYKHKNNDHEWRTGIVQHDQIVDLASAVQDAPSDMQQLLHDWAAWYPRLQQEIEKANTLQRIEFHDVVIGPPIPRPASFRDFYAFEEHVKTARGRRGLEMIPEWYAFPVFYFSNAAAFLGDQMPLIHPKTTQRLDFELEIACVIGKAGMDIPVEEADSYIAGFAILNDWSARDLQMEEVKVGLGPAKGKDFATSMGPWLVTPDELEERRTVTEQGYRYDLGMVARVNGEEYSRGNVRDIYYTFAQMIARASQDCKLYPGDVIGSGTVGTGCILELGSENRPWLTAGDKVELEVEKLGVLRTTILENK